MSFRSSFNSIIRVVSRISIASVAPLVNFASRFGRTVILSRMLAPSEYGVVVALTTVDAILEVITDIGLDRFVTISIGPKRAEAVAAAQQIAFVRGVVVGVFLALVAPLLAAIFGAEAHVDLLRWLAFLPVVRSLANLRIKQIQQEYQYGPEAVATVVSQAGALLVLLPALTLFGDARAMLVSLYVDGIVYVAVTWVVARREKVSSIDPALRREALVYGLPLIVNGLGLVIISQVDKLIVGNLFGLEALAFYSLVLNLAIVPLSPLGSIIGNLSLTFLVKRQDDVAMSKAASFVVTWCFLIIASGYAVGVAMFLDIFVPLIYGSHYSVPPQMRVLVAFLSFVRFCRVGPTVILLFSGRTRQLAAANLISAIGTVLGYAFASISHNLDSVLVGALIGDILVSLFVFQKIPHRSPGKTLAHTVFLLLPLAVACSFSLTDPDASIPVRIIVFAAATIPICVDLGLGYRKYLPRTSTTI